MRMCFLLTCSLSQFINSVHFVLCVCSFNFIGSLSCLDFPVTNLLVTQVHVLVQVTCFKSNPSLYSKLYMGGDSCLLCLLWCPQTTGTHSRHSVNVR